MAESTLGWSDAKQFAQDGGYAVYGSTDAWLAAQQAASSPSSYTTTETVSEPSFVYDDGGYTYNPGPVYGPPAPSGSHTTTTTVTQPSGSGGGGGGGPVYVPPAPSTPTTPVYGPPAPTTTQKPQTQPQTQQSGTGAMTAMMPLVLIVALIALLK